MEKIPTVFITVKGGVAEAHSATGPVRVVIIDYDVEGLEGSPNTQKVGDDWACVQDASFEGLRFMVDPDFIELIEESN